MSDMSQVSEPAEMCKAPACTWAVKPLAGLAKVTPAAPEAA